MFYLVLFATVFVATFVQTVSGFAFGIVLLMGVTYILPYTQSIALVSFLLMVITGIQAYKYRKNIMWNEVPLALFSFFIGNLLAIVLLKMNATSPIWNKLLGIVFIIMAVYLMFWQGKIKIEANKWASFILNFLAGFVSGMFGVGGPFFVMYLLEVAKDKLEYMGTLQIIFFFTMCIEISLRLLNGVADLLVVKYAFYSLPFVLLGIFIGAKVFNKMNVLMIRKIVCYIMIINALVVLIR